MKYNLGVDIIEIDRIQKSVEKYEKHFTEKVFTDVEMKYCRNKKNIYGHLAARFAAKEAIVKCFKTGFSQGIKHTDIEVNNKASGAPFIKLSGRAQDIYNKLGGISIDITLSHSKRDATASAILVLND